MVWAVYGLPPDVHTVKTNHLDQLETQFQVWCIQIWIKGPSHMFTLYPPDIIHMMNEPQPIIGYSCDSQ